jgi:hypothetical protein
MTPTALERSRRNLAATWCAGGVVLAAVAWLAWSAGSVEPRLPSLEPRLPSLEPRLSSREPRVSSLEAGAPATVAGAPTGAGSGAFELASAPVDIALFEGRLSPKPPPPPAAVEVASGRIASLSLIAISLVDGAYVAAIYDAREDRVHLVESGARLAEVEVAAVLPREVSLREGGALVTLRLVEARSGAEGGGL